MDATRAATPLKRVTAEAGPAAPRRSRAQIAAAINTAAIEVFAAHGLDGASTQAIASRAGLSKPQLHYYIESKDALYRQVLQDIVDDWIDVFGFADAPLGPRQALGAYIRRKMMFSFEQPLRSRIFGAEIMRGAPVLRPLMEHSVRRTRQAEAVIRNWMDAGQMARIEPLLFLFHLWAVTQHYADYAEQVRLMRGRCGDDDRDREALIAEVTAFLLRGAGVAD